MATTTITRSDTVAEPGQIDRGQLPILTPDQAAKLRADIAEQERILRCLDGLNTDLLRQDAEDC